MITTKQGQGSWEAGVPGTQWGNAVKLDTVRLDLAGDSAVRAVRAAKATPTKSLQVEGNAETVKALPGEDLASRGQQRDLKPFGGKELGQ